MIFFFSGTGNSRFTAYRLADILDEKPCFIPSSIPEEVLFEGSQLGFVFPVYSWGVPPLVLNFIRRLSDSFCGIIKTHLIPVWAVCTCGDDTCLTPEMLKKELEAKGLNMSGAWSVTMPNTYVLLPGFDVDSQEVCANKLEYAQIRVDEIGRQIKSANWKIDVIRGKFPWLKSHLIYPLFSRWGINTSRWHWASSCIGCGRCAAVCPVRNIEISEGHPKWDIRCVSCLACYHICPVHAVAYGKITRMKGQYTCPLPLSHSQQ